MKLVDALLSGDAISVQMIDTEVLTGFTAKTIVRKMSKGYWWPKPLHGYMEDVAGRTKAWDPSLPPVRTDTFEHFLLDLENAGILTILQGRDKLLGGGE